MYEYAHITGYTPDLEGTFLQVFVPGKNLMEPIEAKQMRNCMIWLDDGRHITALQRKKAYATIADIAMYTGYLPEELKEWLKYYHIMQTGCKYFSLSDCTVDTAREYINTIMDYALMMGVPLTEPGIERTDDIGRYLYSCLKNRRCAVCGRDGETHHVDAIGMGNDRRRVDDSRHRKICLCRTHHTEAHTIGMDAFNKKYKVYGIVYHISVSP